MNVTFHALASLAIGHATAAQSPSPDDPRPLLTPRLLAPAAALALLSHGILDGLKHLYPIPPVLDVPLAPLLLAAWLLLVRPRFRPLLVLTFLAAILPDLIDLGPRIFAKLLHIPLGPPGPHLFPWHWPTGSGSLYHGQDAAISFTNHLIVVTFSLATIIATRHRVLRK